nr:DinB family protein [Lysinibacillus timonensis]
MYRNVNDFISEWRNNSNGTISIFEAVSEEKKGFEIVEGHNSLEWISWHLTNSPAYFIGQIGLELEVKLNPTQVPPSMTEITNAYKAVSENIIKVVKEKLNNEALLNEVDSHGQPTPIGALLRAMVDHQTHHRAQMQVLLRQAGLPVPGVMGPTKEALSSK